MDTSPKLVEMEPALVWGDYRETAVFAQMSRGDLRLICKFCRSTRDPQSLSNRVVSCFHELAVNDASHTFSNRKMMREAMGSAVSRIWDHCTEDTCITRPDAVVEIYEGQGQEIQWRICLEGEYEEYTKSLLPLKSLVEHGRMPQQYETVHFSDLVFVEFLGGRGLSAVVRKSPGAKALYVFKGVFFGDFLEDRAIYQIRRNACYNEIRTISAIPKHSNITPPKTIFVTAKGTRRSSDPTLICGTLSPFLEAGSLHSQIEKAHISGTTLPQSTKAKWCFQIASAISHTHLEGHTYHMDIKPSNMLLDSNENLILIDWEQSGAPKCTVAPEADGSWDVKADPESGKLMYTRYQGPTRKNHEFGWPEWNVFPIWKEECPRALEAAEVFSVGRTMWMLLTQTTEDKLEDGDVDVGWQHWNDSVPSDWRYVVGKCFEHDPNKRPRLVELVSFWGVVMLKNDISK